MDGELNDVIKKGSRLHKKGFKGYTEEDDMYCYGNDLKARSKPEHAVVELI